MRQGVPEPDAAETKRADTNVVLVLVALLAVLLATGIVGLTFWRLEDSQLDDRPTTPSDTDSELGASLLSICLAYRDQVLRMHALGATNQAIAKAIDAEVTAMDPGGRAMVGPAGPAYARFYAPRCGGVRSITSLDPHDAARHGE